MFDLIWAFIKEYPGWTAFAAWELLGRIVKRTPWRGDDDLVDMIDDLVIEALKLLYPKAKRPGT